MSDIQVGDAAPPATGQYIVTNALGRAMYDSYCRALKHDFGLDDVSTPEKPVALDTFRDQVLHIRDGPDAQAELTAAYASVCNFVNSMLDNVPAPRGGMAYSPSVSGERIPSRAGGSASSATTARKSTPSVVTVASSVASGGGGAASTTGSQTVGNKRRAVDAELTRDHRTLQVRLNALRDATIAREFEQCTSVEGKVFSPTMLELSKYADETSAIANQLMRSLLSLAGAADPPSPADILSSSLHAKIASSVPPDDQMEIRNHIAPMMAKLQSATAKLNRLMVRAHKLFWIANHTEHGSWTVVSQILTRERWDEEQLALCQDHKALVTWPEKQAAALAACGYTKAVDKNGALIGPISQDARKLLSGSKGQGHGAGHRTSSRGGATDGAARKRGGRGHPSPKVKVRGGKRHSSQARKPDAGSGVPAASGAAAANPPPP